MASSTDDADGEEGEERLPVKTTEHLSDEQREILDAFQTEKNRLKEELFAKTFSENAEARLFFINEGEAHTDGKNIIVDPAIDGVFADKEALEGCEKVLDWPPVLSTDEWAALKVVTRALTLHECLHLLYTDFPPRWVNDSVFGGENKKKAMQLICNVIEDAYIEAVGASVYDNIEHYLKFGRVSQLLAKNHGMGTGERLFAGVIKGAPKNPPQNAPAQGGNDQLEFGGLPLPAPLERGDGQLELGTMPPMLTVAEKARLFLDVVDYAADLLIYPFVEWTEPEGEVKEYADKTIQLFFDGSAAPSCKERGAYAKKIFEILSPLIPQDEEDKDFADEVQKAQRKALGASSTGNAGNGAAGSGGGQGARRQGRVQQVTRRLFTNLDGSPLDGKDGNTQNSDAVRKMLLRDVKNFASDKNECLRIILYKGFCVEKAASSLSAPPVHKGIRVIENHPKINLSLQKAYQNIRKRYKINIDSYNRRFLRLLRANAATKESRFLFGAGIDSQKLGDTKGRFWYRTQIANEVPDMAVLLLIDGSGSMWGERRDSAMDSSVILHEVLKKQGIEHCVAEHRTQCGGTIDVNILLDFGAREKEELNLMQLDADGCNRDGLALYWAENYINKKTFADNKLLIVLSDGYPNDDYDDYTPPVSTKDTANAVRKIAARGVSVIAVALDDCDDYSTYDDLHEIYPELVACTDLKRLTGQILGIVSRHLV